MFINVFIIFFPESLENYSKSYILKYLKWLMQPFSSVCSDMELSIGYQALQQQRNSQNKQRVISLSLLKNKL